MAEAISSSSNVASGTQLTALVVALNQQSVDRPSPSGGSAQAAGQVLAAGARAGQAAAPVPKDGDAKLAAQPNEQASIKVLDGAVKSLQDYIKPQENIILQVDKASGQTYVKIVDAQTKRMILQIPSAEVLAMACKLREMDNPQTASGGLVDKEG